MLLFFPSLFNSTPMNDFFVKLNLAPVLNDNMLSSFGFSFFVFDMTFGSCNKTLFLSNEIVDIPSFFSSLFAIPTPTLKGISILSLILTNPPIPKSTIGFSVENVLISSFLSLFIDGPTNILSLSFNYIELSDVFNFPLLTK